MHVIGTRFKQKTVSKNDRISKSGKNGAESIRTSYSSEGGDI